MNSDIRLETGFRDNIKVDRLEATLGADGVLALLRLWCYVAIHRPTGILPKWTPDDIATAARWRGDPEQLTAALLKLGFLERSQRRNGGYMVHEWSQHQPYAANAPTRLRLSKRAIRSRWDKELANTEQQKSYIRVSKTVDTPFPIPSPVPDPAPSPALAPVMATKTAYRQAIFLTATEHTKLHQRFGNEVAELAMTILNNDKLGKGKTYESDYHILLDWPVTRAQERLGMKPGGNGQAGREETRYPNAVDVIREQGL